MSAIVRECLKNYYELDEIIKCDRLFSSRLDIDMAIEKLEDTFSLQYWTVIFLVAQGYGAKFIADQIESDPNKVHKIFIRVSSAIARKLGWEYSDNRIKFMVRTRLKPRYRKLEPEETAFIMRKLSMDEKFRNRYNHITIYDTNLYSKIPGYDRLLGEMKRRRNDRLE